ncbi:hypothetical protein EJ069_10400 [Mesorhizobium sp. M2A.F.Ca.ET.043.05.1.1]|uniref:hypothetical protein n=1 Tax=Mesorhizobium sp. M2A.F.Ca.ET.043.05.1.1 TaxID=2493671 RepID=UPI000F74DDDF|nr:hypothetical protein [Mesorhizobium sp. M2A.F.Ca.ET.043.05.1.1]AZO15105.1 hypothetical protein EJ069_10400 [Mesorhizobium sp. M2A.F.Ca.ET.043.05.1.1]
MLHANCYLDNVALVLRKYPSWIIYRLVQAQGKLKKVPHCWRDLSLGEVSAFNLANWGTFDQCRLAAVAAGPEFGIGIVLGQGVTVADIDYREATNVDALKQNILDFRSLFPTLHEWSVSGEGEHLYYFGQLPQGWRSMGGGVTFYDGIENGARFIAVTGNGMAPGQTITAGYDAFMRLGRIAAREPVAPVEYDSITYGDNEALIDEASKYVKGGAGLRPLLNTPILYPGPGNWSAVLGTIVLALASARADKLVAFRVLEASPFVQRSTPRDNETRPRKLHRVFYGRNAKEWERAVARVENAGRVSNGLDKSAALSMKFQSRA